jgi:hypothetical protein
MKNKDIAQITLNITFISSIIAVLFFTYGKDVEKMIVQDQAKNIADELAEDVKIFFPKISRETIAASIKVPEEKTDENMILKNATLVSQSIKIFGTICGVGFLITLLICFFGNVNIFEVILESLVILAFAVCTEILFLNVIARNYKSADANFVKLQILKSIKSEFLA